MFPETMTRVTPELRELVEDGVDIWAFEYPSFYQGGDKVLFEKKVLYHFWTRQIGAETVGRFLHYFRNTMREIMPYYIQRYESVEMMKDPRIKPLDNYSMVEEWETKETGETSAKTEDQREGSTTSTGSTKNTDTGHSTSTRDGTNKDTRVKAETPGGTLNFGVTHTTASDIGGIISHASETEQTLHAYIDNDASDHSNTATGESTGNVVTGDSGVTSQTGSSETITKHMLTRSGNIGVTTYAQLLEGYRQTFLNIDMEIINELDACFLGVY